MTRVLGRDPTRCCVKLAAWPAMDRRLWLDALRAGDILEPAGARARYRPASNRKTAAGYGRWLGWLAGTGRLDPDHPPAARITREAVAAYLQALLAVNRPITIRCRLHELHDAALVMDPTGDWTWIRHLSRRLPDNGDAVRDKRARIVDTATLVDLGLRLMEEPAGRVCRWRHATRFRDGLAIALLALRPLRRKNFVALRLDRHLVRRGEVWWLDIPATETKTGVPLEMPWPPILAPYLETWLARHRPCLAARRGRWAAPLDDALWVSSHGSPMTGMALYDRIIRQTGRALGKSVNPHLFRDSAATQMALEDPEHIRLAAALLGHRNLTTTERYYNMARSMEAAAHWQDVIRDLRSEIE